MKLFKLKRYTKLVNEYEGIKRGRIVKDVVFVKLTFLGIPIKTIKRYKSQYNGEFIEVDRYYKPSEKQNYKMMLIESCDSHSVTKDYLKDILVKIDEECDDDKVCKIVLKAISELEDNEKYSVTKDIEL